MNLHITHPAVRKVIEKCEQQVREMTGNYSVSISFINDYYTLEFDRIAHEICKITRVSFDDLKTPSRKTKLVQTRQLIAFYARRFTKISFREIGEHFGDRDHTTIMASIDRLNNLIDSNDEDICNMVNKINRRLREVIDEQE
jgi:chromosomal replication initiation ATPase DnaA